MQEHEENQGGCGENRSVSAILFTSNLAHHDRSCQATNPKIL